MAGTERANYREEYERAAGLLLTVLKGLRNGQLKGGTLIVSHEPFEMKSLEQHILDTMGWAYAEPEPPVKDERQARLPL